MKKILFFFLITFISFAKDYECLNLFSLEKPEYIEFTKGYSRYSIPFEHYLFTKKTTYVRKSPDIKSKILKKVFANKNINALALIKHNGTKWYKVSVNGEIGYVLEKTVLKREFKFEFAVNEALKINEFLNNVQGELKVVDAYSPLFLGASRKKDAFGNSSNQSIKAEVLDQNTYFNLQDRTILTIDYEQKKGYNVKVHGYPDLYLSKKYKNNIKNFVLDDNEVRKYIFIDKKNQNLFAFEKDNETGVYKILITALVTTGKSSKYGFETPYGNFLVAITKPVMMYSSDLNRDKIIGDAKYATRFTGGAYIHGIPSLYEPINTRQSRKKITENKLGTYPLSHKCVRVKDEVAKYLYDWQGVKGKNKFGYRLPLEPVIVIVR